tara:strand:+ start:48 stop:677 length:630 start_codon:yes stop_codon:yes gene_type:complete
MINYVDLIIKTIPLCFKEIHHKRIINNIYFDDLEYQSYLANINGLSMRDKVRLRWYGEIYGNINSILEIKRKKGLVGTKFNYKIHPFYFQKNSNIKLIKKNILSNIENSHNLKEFLKYSYPTLLNSYVRKYYETFNKDFRITVDSRLKNFSINNATGQHTENNLTESFNILELKYLSTKESDASIISNFLPFRMTKFSKYIYGINNNYN